MENNIIEKINEVKRAADIVDVTSRYVNVIKKGRSYVAICPFHNDTNPSMSISKDKQIFKCFVCNTGGDVFTFVSKFKNMSYMKAVKEVADLVGADFTYNDTKTSETKTINIKNQAIYDCLKEAAAFYKNTLYSSKEALEYCVNRNLDQKVLNDFAIGYSNDFEKLINYLQQKGFKKDVIYKTGLAIETDGRLIDRFADRLIFPITDLDGHIVAFSGRIIKQSDMAKYVNSPETDVFIKGNTLYNFSNAKQEILKEKRLYICEGFMDCIALCRSGIKNSVALMGTAFTKEHLSLIKYLGVEVIICLDGDNPGNINANKLANQLEKLNVSVKVVPNYKDVKDLDEFFVKYGSEELVNHVTTSCVDTFDFTLYLASKLEELKNNENKKAFLKKMCQRISKMSNEDIDIYANKLNKELGFSLSTINSLIDSFKKEQGNDTISAVEKYKKLTKYQDMQQRLISSMLDSPEAIEIFIEALPNMQDESFKKIAFLIADYYQANKDNIDMKFLLTDIFTKIQTDMSGDDSIMSALTSLDTYKMKYPFYNKDSFLALIYEINEISPLEIRLENIKEEIMFATDTQTKNRLVLETLTIKKLIKEKKEKKILGLSKGDELNEKY